MAETKQSERSGSGVMWLVLLGLPFLAVGGAMLWWAGAMGLRWVRAGDWVEVPAVVEEVSLEHHRGSARKRGTSYEVHCTYRYTFAGRQYTGERVGVGSGSDHLGSWQEETYRRLKEARQRGETVTCYVDPDQPDASLLDRRFRWPLFIFYMAMVGTGPGTFSRFVAGLSRWAGARWGTGSPSSGSLA